VSRALVYNNASCLKCNCVEKRMVKIGAFIMCNKCFAEEFITSDPVCQERKLYLKWLEVYKNKVEEEERERS